MLDASHASRRPHGITFHKRTYYLNLLLYRQDVHRLISIRKGLYKYSGANWPLRMAEDERINRNAGCFFARGNQLSGLTAARTAIGPFYFRDTNFSLPLFMILNSFECVVSADSIAGRVAFLIPN